MSILTWPNAPHSLELTQEYGHPVNGVLRLKKEKPQRITVVFPKQFTLAMIKDAWAAQGEQWDQLFVCPGTVFVAQRAIWLPGDLALLWSVFHVNNVPHDLCGILPMTKAEWTYGTVQAAVSV